MRSWSQSGCSSQYPVLILAFGPYSQIAESVSQLRDLMAYSTSHGLGAIGEIILVRSSIKL